MTPEVFFECIPPKSSERYLGLLEFCHTNHSYVLASLPFIASEIAEYCGYPAFFELIREKGGTKINIAGGHNKLKERYALSISPANYERMLFHMENDWVDLPSAWGVFVALRRTAILSEITQKKLPKTPAPSLPRSFARKYGVSERYIRKLLRNQA